MIVGSLDIGIRNIGFCVYDSGTKRVLHLRLLNLIYEKGVKMCDGNVVYLVRRAIDSAKELFAMCDVVCIEKQLTRKMILIQIAFEALLDRDTAVLQVSARSIKCMFGTGTGKHKSNKKVAIQKVYRIVDRRTQLLIDAFPKKDDVCDAILQAIYLGENVKRLLDAKIASCKPVVRKKRKK
jgi:hypothetical protein